MLKTGSGKTVQIHLSFSKLPDQTDEESCLPCGVVTDLSLHKLRMQKLEVTIRETLCKREQGAIRVR